jgi:tape measure domain-containing protein
MSKAQKQTGELDKMFNRLTNSAIGFFSLQQGAQLVKDSTEVAAKLEALDTQMKQFAGGQEYAKNMKLLEGVTKGLNTPIMQATDEYTKFYAATKLAGLGGDQSRLTFMGVSMAARVMGVDAQRFGLAMNAITQMIGKGKVSAEELRGQLGEQLPGAFSLAARSMGMTEQQLNKALEGGAVNAKEFVSKFGPYLIATFRDKIPAAMKTTRAAMDGVENKILLTTAAIGTKATPIYLKWLQIKLWGLNVLHKAILFYERNKTVIDALAVTVGVITIATWTYGKVMLLATAISKGLAFAQLFLRAATLASAMGAGVFRAAWIALNIAFATSPIGLIITAIVALAAGLIYAYSQCDKFRAIIMGLWEVAKVVFHKMGMSIKLMLSPFTLLFALLTDGMEGVKKAAGELERDLIKDRKITIGAAFDKGYNQSMARSAQAKKEEAAADPMALAFGNDPELQKLLAGIKTGDEGAGGSGQSVSAGRSVRNVRVDIKNLVGQFTIQTTNLKQSAQDTKKLVQDALVRAVLDAEGAL